LSAVVGITLPVLAGTAFVNTRPGRAYSNDGGPRSGVAVYSISFGPLVLRTYDEGTYDQGTYDPPLTGVRSFDQGNYDQGVYDQIAEPPPPGIRVRGGS
jgi:hypothetical protein